MLSGKLSSWFESNRLQILTLTGLVVLVLAVNLVRCAVPAGRICCVCLLVFAG